MLDPSASVCEAAWPRLACLLLSFAVSLGAARRLLGCLAEIFSVVALLCSLFSSSFFGSLVFAFFSEGMQNAEFCVFNAVGAKTVRNAL